MGSVKILKASAGSGKTYQLAYEYIRNVIREPWLYRNILAVTFTNKATEEMKLRIISEINALANGTDSSYAKTLQRELGMSAEIIQDRATEVRTKILHDYSHFTVVTIDKFFQRIIRSFIKELGIDLNFNLELQTDSLLEKAADRLIENIASDKKLHDWILSFVEEKIDQNKRWDIKSEICEIGQELFKEQYRLNSDRIPPKEELGKIVIGILIKSRSITEQIKSSANEILQTIAQHNLNCNDFAYGRAGFMSYVQKMSQGTIEAYGKRVSDALASDEKWFGKTAPRKADIQAITPIVRPLLEELCQLYDTNIVFINTAALLSQNFRSYALLSDLSAAIADICAEENILPISETNHILAKLINGNDTPFIYEKVGNTFSHFMIDEFQDTSLQQWNNFVPLLDNAISQSSESPVLLVGDIKQSIYRWRGGDWQILAKMVAERFDSPQQVNLDTNYRSEKTVVEFNNTIIEHCVELDNRLLNEQLDTASQTGRITLTLHNALTNKLQEAYTDHKQKSAKAGAAGFIRIVKKQKEYTQENLPEQKPILIDTIEELQQRGYSAQSIAILVRYNREAVETARILLDYKATNPESPYCYDIITQEALTIGNAPVIGFIVAVMRLSCDTNDSIKKAVYNKYQKIPIEQILSDSEYSFITHLRLQSLEEATEQIIMHYGLNRTATDIAYIQAFQEQVHNFSTTKIADIPLFMKWWEDTGCRQSVYLPQKTDAINIITIHKSKGLQYKCVIIPYCEWELTPNIRSLIWAENREKPLNALGRVPLKWRNSIGDSLFAEEYYNELILSHIDNINTFYVAVTRAEEELYIISKNHRSPSNISKLVDLSFTTDKQQVSIGSLEGRIIEQEDSTIYEFGTPHTYPKKQSEATVTDEYPSRPVGSRLRFKLNSQRYFEDSDTPTVLSPRNYGIIMHRVFEQIDNVAEIDTQVNTLRTNGYINDTEATQTRKKITEALKNPIIHEWFSVAWDTIRNESNIIVPGDKGGYRPDRVMTKGRQATVVDYKFGQHKTASHNKQIGRYMQLLSEMGYRDIKGYIWYFELNEVEAIAL